jgi:CP family cyanate transporter-like MFS transporter
MRGRRLLFVAVLLVALNLRGAIAAVSPVLPDIRAEESLSAATAGLLTTLPVLCFAAVAPFGVWLGRRVGLERAILLGLLGIAVGTVVRVTGGTAVLLAGTVVVGAAMTVGNVLVPVVAKRDFAERAGTLTGLYTAGLCAGAAATAALTAPIAGLVGWEVALASWALLAGAAAVVWQVATRPARRGPARDREAGGAPVARASGVWRSPVAWSVTLLLGTQSVTYYSVTAWLPTQLVDDAGLDLAAAGLGMSVFQILGIAGTLLIPVLVARSGSQSPLGVGVAVGWAVMIVGLLLWPDAWLAWCVVGGVAQGAGISYAFTVLVLRSHDAAAAHSLSGMAQLVGYGIGTTGPLVVGALYESTGGWTVPLGALTVVCVAMGVVGALAGRDRTVGEPSALVSR